MRSSPRRKYFGRRLFGASELTGSGVASGKRRRARKSNDGAWNTEFRGHFEATGAGFG